MAQLSILHVEDDDSAALLVRVALQETFPEIRYDRAGDIDNALRFLSENVEKPGAPLPSVVLLDLNLPRRSGFEMLKLIRELPLLAGLSIVVFTSSSAPGDRKVALELGATAYVIKPSTFEGYLAMLHDVVKLAAVGGCL